MLFAPWKKQLRHNILSLWEQQFSQSPTERQTALDIIKHTRPILQACRGDRDCENREKLRVYMTYAVGWLFFLLYSWSSFMRCPTVCVRKMHIFSHSSPAVMPQLHLDLWPAVHSFQLGLQLQQHQSWQSCLAWIWLKQWPTCTPATSAGCNFVTSWPWKCSCRSCHGSSRIPRSPTLPHFPHLPEAQYFRWSVSAERRPRWWTRCGLTHDCDAVRTGPSALPSAAVFRCPLVCFSVQQSSALHSGSWHGRAAAGGKRVFVCVRRGLLQIPNGMPAGYLWY